MNPYRHQNKKDDKLKCNNCEDILSNNGIFCFVGYGFCNEQCLLTFKRSEDNRIFMQKLYGLLKQLKDQT